MLTKFGFGGKQGKGNQFISWIHEKDFARAIEFISEKEMSGIVNVVSPKPIANYEFMKKLRKSIGVSFGISTSKFLLKIGSFIIRTEPELVLKSRNVIPKRLQENGFHYEYDTLEKAFENLLKL